MDKWTIIGISGATCSGKTTIAKELQKKLINSHLVHQDSYYYPFGSSKLKFIEGLQHYDWDSVTAIDTERFISDIKTITQLPTNGDDNVLIIEGHLIFNISIFDLCNARYFLDISKETSRVRRLPRKYEDYDLKYFHEHVWPTYELHKKIVLQNYPDLSVLDGELDVSVNYKAILSDLKRNFQLKIEDSLITAK